MLLKLVLLSGMDAIQKRAIFLFNKPERKDSLQLLPHSLKVRIPFLFCRSFIGDSSQEIEKLLISSRRHQFLIALLTLSLLRSELKERHAYQCFFAKPGSSRTSYHLPSSSNPTTLTTLWAEWTHIFCHCCTIRAELLQSRIPTFRKSWRNVQINNSISHLEKNQLIHDRQYCFPHRCKT